MRGGDLRGIFLQDGVDGIKGRYHWYPAVDCSVALCAMFRQPYRSSCSSNGAQ